MRFATKTALITGGSTGIGLVGACRLATDGVAVAVSGRRAEQGADAVATIEAWSPKPSMPYAGPADTLWFAYMWFEK